jgi:lipopolysaccharide transport system permease protein
MLRLGRLYFSTTMMSQNTTYRKYLSFGRLLWQMGVRDIQVRYKGSVLGVLWSLLTPLLTVALYTFLFSVVFKTQWAEDMRPPMSRQMTQINGAEESAHGQYALILFAGLILHSFLAEIMTRACSIVVVQSNLVKKVVFPLHVLPAVVVFTALFQLLVSSGLLIFCVLLVQWVSGLKGLFAAWVSLPLLVVPLVCWGLGAAWLLGALGVFLRDLHQIMGWLVMALMFSAPILYPLVNVSERYRAWLYLNPLTWLVETWRHVIYWGAWPIWTEWSVYALLGVIFAICSAWVFERMKKGFADVL